MNLLGKASLLLSLVCFLFTYGVKVATGGWMPFMNFGVGFGLFFLVFSLVINLKYLKTVFRSESTHFLSKSFLVLLLTVILLGGVNYILFKKTETIDLTEKKIHSLSEMTTSLVRALPDDLNFVYFHIDSQRTKGYERQVREQVERYQDLSTKVHFQSHSVFRRPDLVQKFRVGDDESSMFIEYQGRIQRLSDITERDVTNAILKLTKESKKVYFLSQFDSRGLYDDSSFGLTGIRQQLERLHYEISDLKSLDQIPKDAALLVVPGPREPVDGSSLALLKDYVDQGGSLFVAVDPAEKHGLADFLSDYGITLNSNFVFSAQARVGQSKLLVPTHRGQSQHPISQSILEGKNPYLFVSSSLSPSSESASDILVSSILEFTPDSVARADINEDSEIVSEGRQFAGLIAEAKKEDGFKLAVVGDSDFLTNRLFSTGGNYEFILGLMNYLGEDEDLLKLKPVVARTTYLVLTSTQMNLYAIFFMLPFALFFFVVALFFRLRKLF